MAAATTSSPKISAPGAERLVGGDDQAGAFVAARDEREHEVGGLGVERDVADLVDDQQRDAAQALEFFFEAPGALGVAEAGDPFGRSGERDAVAGQAGADPERDRQVRFAGAGRSEQDDVLAAGEEVELAEVFDDGLLDRALEGEVELLERFVGREPRGADPDAPAGGFARGDLGGEQRLGEALIAPFVGAGPLGELGQRPGRSWRLECAEEVRELGVGLGHAGISRS